MFLRGHGGEKQREKRGTYQVRIRDNLSDESAPVENGEAEEKMTGRPGEGRYYGGSDGHSLYLKEPCVGCFD